MSAELHRVPVRIYPHTWQQCRGPMVVMGQDREKARRASEVLKTLWTTMTPVEKLNFHRGSCLSQRNTRIDATLAMVIAVAKRAMDGVGP